MRRAACEYVTVLLDEYGGNVMQAARAAGLNRSHLYKLVRKNKPELLSYAGRKDEVLRRVADDNRRRAALARDAERLGPAMRKTRGLW